MMDATDGFYTTEATVSVMAAEMLVLNPAFSDMVIEDARFAVTSHSDYAYGTYSPGYSFPDRLEQQLTLDYPSTFLQMSTMELVTDTYFDPYTSVYEAMYQVATGVGYDMDNDGNVDEGDVRPFIADYGDAFGGRASGSYDLADTSTGLHGGVGYRDEALRVAILYGDGPFRHPEDNGYPPGSSVKTTDEVLESLRQNHVRVCGVSSAFPTSPTYFTTVEEMLDISDATRCVGDLYGTGEYHLPIAWAAPYGFSAGVATLSIVETLLASTPFDVTLELDDTPEGLTWSVDPPVVYDTPVLKPLNFKIQVEGSVRSTPEDQVYTLNFKVKGDGQVLLGYAPVTILIPGSR